MVVALFGAVGLVVADVAGTVVADAADVVGAAGAVGPGVFWPAAVDGTEAVAGAAVVVGGLLVGGRVVALALVDVEEVDGAG